MRPSPLLKPLAGVIAVVGVSVRLLGNSPLGEHVAVQLVGPLHLPGERAPGGEERLDGLERSPAGFWVEEEDDGDPEKVESEEEKVCAVLFRRNELVCMQTEGLRTCVCFAYLHRAEHDRVHQRGHANADRPPRDPESVPLSAQVRGEDLRRHQEGDRSPGGGVREVEQEEHGDSSLETEHVSQQCRQIPSATEKKDIPVQSFWPCRGAVLLLRTALRPASRVSCVT